MQPLRLEHLQSGQGSVVLMNSPKVESLSLGVEVTRQQVPKADCQLDAYVAYNITCVFVHLCLSVSHFFCLLSALSFPPFRLTLLFILSFSVSCWLCVHLPVFTHISGFSHRKKGDRNAKIWGENNLISNFGGWQHIM